MNANAPVLRFSCARDEYGEAIVQEKDWLSTVRPLGYRNLQSFLERRRAPKHRKHIDRLLQEYGCQDLEGFLRVTHAVSLNDTYWVKAEESGQTWADVSLYTNDFDVLAHRRAIDRLRAAKAGARPSRWTKACPRRPALRRRTGSRCRRRWPGSRRRRRSSSACNISRSTRPKRSRTGWACPMRR